VPGERQFYEYQGVKCTHYQRFEGNDISQSSIFFSIQTSNHDLRKEYSKWDSAYSLPYSPLPIDYFSSKDSTYNFTFLDSHIDYIEQQIKQDFDVHNQIGTAKGINYADLIGLEYRITEIKNIAISTVNTPLFGKPAGEPLNEFFTIVNYDPSIIISAPTETLVYGHSSNRYPTSIDEWLRLSPFGQSNMYLEPNRKMEGLPLDVQFVVQMETAEGLVISDTTRVLTITE